MQQATYQVTNKDVPAMRRSFELWKELFGFSLDNAQLYLWFTRYPESMIQRAICLTHKWLLDRRPSVVNSLDAECYASGLLKNMLRLKEKADALLGVEL